MIGLDTNVLVRLLAQDHPEQTRKAHKLIREECTESAPAFVNLIVLAETVWVLERSFDYRMPEICHALERLLQVREIEVQTPDEVWAALSAYREQRAGFSDALIDAVNRLEGCKSTVCFDKKAVARLDGFVGL
jgi:predicted nucleic-acid-binding protein